jgi:hypothetical protein
MTQALYAHMNNKRKKKRMRQFINNKVKNKLFGKAGIKLATNIISLREQPSFVQMCGIREKETTTDFWRAMTSLFVTFLFLISYLLFLSL